MKPSAIVVCAGLTVLVGCGSGGQDPVIGAVRAALRPSSTEKGPSVSERQVQIRKTLADIDKSEPVLMITIAARDAVATLVRAGQNGAVVTWVDASGISISLQDGVIVGTRGLGHDLMVGEAKQVLASARAASPTHYQRRQRTLNAVGVQVEQVWTCTGTPGQNSLTEICRARAAEPPITNSFVWRRGQLVYARQWLGPELGFVDLELL